MSLILRLEMQTHAVKIRFVPPYVLELDTTGPLDALNRAVLDAFDNQDGLQKLLKYLGEVASMRSRASLGTKDRKLGPAFMRVCWPAIEKFLNYNGHITMLELCQAPPVERYLHDLLQYTSGVLHIVTLVTDGRKLLVSATVSNDHSGITVILDAAHGAGYVDPMTLGGKQGRWQKDLSQVAIEVMAIVTNPGRASTLAATDAATLTLHRIERVAIAAATSIT
ncbi:DDB1- and CUL4-associated factor homolog 1 [Tanacetum coccineum]